MLIDPGRDGLYPLSTRIGGTMKTAEQYRTRAAFVRQLSQSLRPQAIKSFYLEMAAELDRLASRCGETQPEAQKLRRKSAA